MINMTMVTLSTKYCLSDEDVEVLIDNDFEKSTVWWMRSLTEDRFMNYGKRIPANEPFRVELDLPDGEYQFGCGKYDVKNSNDKPCSQKVTLYIEGGKVNYCKWNELPSKGEKKDVPKVDYEGGSGGSKIDWNADGRKKDKMDDDNTPIVLMEDYYYCNKFGFVLPKGEIPTDDSCFEVRDAGSKFDIAPTVACRNCMNVRRLYRTDAS